MSAAAVYGLLILCVLASFCGALVSPWWWGGVAFAVLPLLLEKLDDSQPSDFDGPGVGIEVAVFIAVVNVIVWLLGRWIRHRVRGVDEPS